MTKATTMARLSLATKRLRWARRPFSREKKAAPAPPVMPVTAPPAPSLALMPSPPPVAPHAPLYQALPASALPVSVPPSSALPVPALPVSRILALEIAWFAPRSWAPHCASCCFPKTFAGLREVPGRAVHERQGQ